MDCLARLIRRPIVASGTRNALASSVVVRPPTAPRVSASCDALDSAGLTVSGGRMCRSDITPQVARRRSVGHGGHTIFELHRLGLGGLDSMATSKSPEIITIMYFIGR